VAVKLIVCVGVFVFLADCVRNVWVKPGTSQQDFSNDRYDCLQQSQQHQSSAYVNPYGGAGSSGAATNIVLFGACMNAHGWYLERQPVS
jgi:hypothetical protein